MTGYPRTAGIATVLAAVAGAASQDEGRRAPVPMTVGDVIRDYLPGSGNWGWITETAELYGRDRAAMQDLEESIRRHGLMPARDENPICLGSDGRVWDGHHRLIAAFIVDSDTPLPPDVVMGFEDPSVVAALGGDEPVDAEGHSHCDCCGHRYDGDHIPGRECPCDSRAAWDGAV